MLKIRIKADLRCPKGHRLRGGSFRASCLPCAELYDPGSPISLTVVALKKLIADYQQLWYPEQEADNGKA